MFNIKRDPKFKSKLCSKFLKGFCQLKEECLFAHGNHELNMHKLICMKIFGRGYEQYNYQKTFDKFINQIKDQFEQLYKYLFYLD